MSGGDSTGQGDIKTLGNNIGSGLLSQFNKGIAVNDKNLFSGMGPQTRNGLGDLRAATRAPNNIDEATTFSRGLLSPKTSLTEQTMGGVARGDYLDNVDPNAQAVLDRAVDRTATDTNSQFMGAGRFGADAHAGALADSIGGMRAQFGAENRRFELGRQREALGDIEGARQQGINNGQWATGVAPGLLQAGYIPAQTRVGIGQAFDANRQGLLTGSNDLFNRKNGRDWDNLARTFGLLGGAENLPGLKKETPWWMSALSLGAQAL